MSLNGSVLVRVALWAILMVPICQAQPRPYVGVLGGVSTLSADARTVVDSNPAAASSYKPENGPTVNLFGGVHWNNYLSFQLDYLWNRNGLTLDSLRGKATGYERSFFSRQHAATANALVYFRPRESKVRPYLSAGTGFVHFTADPRAGGIANGINPPGRFSSTKPTLQVAVGIDLKIRAGWAFRYSFSETVSGNPVSPQLAPPGMRVLMNFRNLFGIVKTF